MSKERPKVIELSELSNQNRNQFLQFLARNNFAFQNNKGQYAATVTIPNQTPSNILKNKNMNETPRTTVDNQRIYPKNKKQFKSPSQLKTPQKVKHQKKVTRNLYSAKNSSPNPMVQHIVIQEDPSALKKNKSRSSKNNLTDRSIRSKTPSKSQLQFPKNQQKLVHRKQDFIKLNVQKIKELNKKQQKQQKQQKQLKTQIGHRKLGFNKGKSQKQNTILDDTSFQRATRLNCKTQYRSLQKWKAQKLQKYTDQFSMKLRNQRPMKWGRCQLQRFIQQTYCKCFVRNAQLIQNSQFQNIFKFNKQDARHFSRYIQKQFKRKLNNDKKIQFNLSNMVYSLASYLQTDSSSDCLNIFEQFISGAYKYEDMIFFLFVRNCLEKHLSTTLSQQAATQKCCKMDNNPKLTIKMDSLPKLLTSIIGQDQQIIKTYYEVLSTFAQKNRVGRVVVNAYTFLKVLLEDYRQKRLQDNSFAMKDFDSQVSNRLNDTLKKIQQRHKNIEAHIQQMTFADQTEQQVDLDQSTQQFQFWDYKSPVVQNYVSIRQSQIDQLQQIVCKKLAKKVKQLVQTIADEFEEQIKEKLQSLLSGKSQALLRTVFQMSKIKWFTELRIEQPSNEDIQTIQKLQVMVRKLKKKADSKDIGQFCKQLLTVRQLTSQLQKILV